jgi:uncharacterized membrane protein
MLDRGSLVWVGVAPLIAIALLSAAGRALALATESEPFAALYAMLPAPAVEDGRTLDRWFAQHAVLTWTHIVAGTLVLALVVFQFIPRIRQRQVNFHRWTGRLVLLVAVPTALSGLALQARSPYGGVLAASAIALAGTLFLSALVRAYRAIRRGDVVRHREWMIRLLAVALGVGTVRLVSIPLILLTGRRPLELIGVAFWLGFALPVVAGEFWIRSTRPAAVPAGPGGRP